MRIGGDPPPEGFSRGHPGDPRRRSRRRRTGGRTRGGGSSSSSPARRRTSSSRSCSSRSSSWSAAARRRTTVGLVLPGQAGGRDRPEARRPRSSRSTAPVSARADISDGDLGLEGQAGDRDGAARTRGRHARPGPARRLIDGAYRLGFVLRGEKLGIGASAWQSLKLTGIVTKEIGKSLGRLVHGQGRKDISSPVGIIADARPQRRPGNPGLPLGARADQPLAGADEHAPAAAARRRPHRLLDHRGHPRPRRRPRGLRAGLGGRDRARPLPVRDRDLERRRPARRRQPPKSGRLASHDDFGRIGP